MSDVPTHGTYDTLADKWEYAWEVYTGEYADQANIETYLKRRQQGEHHLNYEERKSEALADPALDYGLVVDSLNGIQFTAEPKSSRTWQETSDDGQPVRDVSLGDPEEEGTRAYRLKRDIDAEGTALKTLLKHVGVRFKTKQWVWGVVDAAIKDGNDNVLRPPIGSLVEPEQVVNWRSENGRLVEVLTTTTIDAREDVADEWEENQVDAYIRYDLDGWTIVDDEMEELVEAPVRTSAEYEYWATEEQNQRILPIFCQRLPLPRRVGYLMARKNVALFNKESELDNYGRLICIPRLSLAAEQAQKNAEDLAEGTVLTHPPESSNEFLTPPAQAFSALDKRLERKRQAYMVQCFREYGNAAQEETATEKEQDWAAGVAAYLTLEAGALQDFERQLMWRMEQAVFGDTPSAWGQYSIERSTDFEPQDVKEQLEKLISQIFPGRVPVPDETAAGILTDYLSEHGADPDLEDVQEEVEAQRSREAQSTTSAGPEFLG